MMIETSLQQILNSPHDNNHKNIALWIEQNIEKQEALHEVLSVIHKNPKYFHIAIEYAEESVRRWNYIHPKILDAMEFVFTHFKKLSEENTYITDFLRYNSTKLLQNKNILEKISKIDPTTLHSTLQLRLLNDFRENFHHNLLLKNHKNWYQKVLVNISEKNPEFIRNIISSHPEDLFEKFGFSLSEGYKLLFHITQTHGIFTNVNMGEMAFLKRLGTEKIFKTLKAMDFENFCHFIDRFANKNLSSGINFLAFSSIHTLNSDKRFYLSIIYSHKLFQEDERDDFLQFILDNISKNQGDIFLKNYFFHFNNILEFFTTAEISIFSHPQTTIKFLKMIEQNEDLIFHFQKYLKELGNNKQFHNIRQIRLILQSINFKQQKCKTLIYNFIIWELLNFHPLEDFIDTENRFKILSHSDELLDIKKHILDIPHKKLQKLSYKNMEKFLEIVMQELDMNFYAITDFLDNFSKGNRKMKYLAMRVSKKQQLDIKSLQFRNIRERCFFQNSFPIKQYHWIRLKTGK